MGSTFNLNGSIRYLTQTDFITSIQKKSEGANYILDQFQHRRVAGVLITKVLQI
jgi:hypothetical protein